MNCDNDTVAADPADTDWINNPTNLFQEHIKYLQSTPFQTLSDNAKNLIYKNVCSIFHKNTWRLKIKNEECNCPWSIVESRFILTWEREPIQCAAIHIFPEIHSNRTIPGIVREELIQHYTKNDLYWIRKDLIDSLYKTLGVRLFSNDILDIWLAQCDKQITTDYRPIRLQTPYSPRYNQIILEILPHRGFILHLNHVIPFNSLIYDERWATCGPWYTPPETKTFRFDCNIWKPGRDKLEEIWKWLWVWYRRQQQKSNNSTITNDNHYLL